LESFVREAFKQKDSEIVGKSIRGNNTYIEDNDDKSIEEAFRKPRIVVVGCGGAGNNTINRLYNMGVKGADVIAVNTDGVHLNAVKADRKVLIGQRLTKGLGAGGFPDIGAKAAELSREVFEEMFADADLVFLTAGMGGGTGTGAAPVVADVAKKMGAIVVGMVSTPFIVERARRNAAKKGNRRPKASCRYSYRVRQRQTSGLRAKSSFGSIIRGYGSFDCGYHKRIN